MAATDDWVLRAFRERQQQSREQDATDRRLQLIAAMASAAAENGYARTTVDDLSTRTGIPAAEFHQHFQDRESCFLAAYDLGVDVLMTAIEDAIGVAERPPLARAEAMVSTYLKTLSDAPDFARSFLLEAYAVGPRALQRQADLIERFVGLWGDILGPDAEGGLDPFLCEALVGAIGSLVTARVAAGRTKELPELCEPIMRLVQRLIATRPAAPTRGA